MTSSKDVIFAITEEVGTDITYIRQKHGEENAAYFTGIEIGVLFGGTILANFLIGMIKGATEELTDAAGKGLGKELVATILKKLNPIAEGTRLKETNTEELLRLADQHQKALDEIRSTLASNLAPEAFRSIIGKSVSFEREQIRIHLRQNGFTEEKAELQAEHLTLRIQQELSVE